MDGAPHRADLFLAMAVAEMRQYVDRRVGEEIDVVAAAPQRRGEVAGIERLEKIQDALPVEIFGHCCFSRRRSPRLAFQCTPLCTEPVEGQAADQPQVDTASTT